MAMASFNKNNPFVIIMRKLEHELYNMTIKSTKLILLSSILNVLVSFGTFIFVKNALPLILLQFLFLLYNVYNWRKILTKSQLSTVNNIIYSEEFSAIYVNNEQLFDIINAMNQAKGNLDYFINRLYFDSSCVAVLSVIYITLAIF